MRACVDREKCQGHGRCAAVAPRVFELDDLGYNAVDGEVTIDPDHEEEARLGAAACPESAITLLEI